ncbi:ankyrin repeat protein [Seminavis robusta]|uniref:Ankyrin repeat protein n=1 Tax=Seminavis robusta TaxID=568900 RepID=A0A9N8DCK1_9STRA|nr:ankyrin repeat protein [Seminavis robusta]|eukprot:Sro77_g042200.1 ankyrin repeat protein (308) ;mRNA; r:95107-96030
MHVTDTHYAAAFYNMSAVQFWKDSLIPTSTSTTTISNEVATCGNVPEDPFEWLVARERNSKILRLEAIQRAIAHGGSIAVLKWALQQDYLRTTNPGTMALFALHGHSKACQFLRNKQNCPWNESATANAALNGHLKTLKWLRANNCPWNERTCTNAAKNGHLHVLQYARDNHCPWNEHYLCQTAAGHGQIHILQWLAEQGLVLHLLFDELTCLKAVQHGQLQVVQWLHEQQLWREGNYCFCDEAAGSGHLHVLKWLVDKGLSHCDATTSEFASLSKNWDVLKFLHDLGCHHAGGYLDAARQNGELLE